MTISVKTKLQSLSKSRQRKIAKRAEELIALEMTLRELRRNRQLTQTKIAEILGIGQDSISRLETRSDIKLSSLQSYVEALGGQLRILADFPDSDSVELLLPEGGK